MVVNKKAVANIGADTVRNFSCFNSATRNAIATKIGEVTAAINSLIASVNSGNTNEAAALAQFI